MPHYSGCRVVVEAEEGGPASEDDDADLQLGDGAFVLSYWDDLGPVVLAGAEAAEEPGCYEWTARSRPRHGTLRREAAGVFTGRWFQGEECGTLRVELPAVRGGDEPAPEEER